MQKTLGIIKPDAVRRELVADILFDIKQSGLKLVAVRSLRMSQQMAGSFYEVHKERPFYGELVAGMSDRIVVFVLEAENAVAKYREVMGATDPKQADAGTLRAKYALNIGENSVHGSDSADNAQREIAFFFAEGDLV